MDDHAKNSHSDTHRLRTGRPAGAARRLALFSSVESQSRLASAAARARRQPDGGRWIASLGAAAGSLLPLLKEIARPALQRLRNEARRIAPILRRFPRRWSDDRQPSEESFDDETRRISQDSWQRHGYPTVRFRSESELRDYLGPAGPSREWHHIVEKRLAGRPGFPAEKVHSTDNIISLPVEVHRRVSANMSSKADEFGDLV